MGPSPAEVARTLVRGRLPGALHLAGQRAPVPVCHATDHAGRPLVLVRDGDAVARALGPPWQQEPAAALLVDDRPPVDGAPSLGQVRVTGRLRRLGPAQAVSLVLTFAEANPVPDLFDVGESVQVCALEIDQVVLHQVPCGRPRHARTVALADYAVADPDPLHEHERDLLLDLADHHQPQISGFFRRLLAGAGMPCRPDPRAVRVNRYGFVVDAAPAVGQASASAVDRDGAPAGARVGSSPGRRWVRLDFATPVSDRRELARLLHPVLFHHHDACPRRRDP